ncbi:MAG TPA: hypothetical protein VE197_09280, partial [Mycobacterium sp.]|nr:hypothetical protein [Mycobacterium sp.]
MPIFLVVLLSTPALGAAQSPLAPELTSVRQVRELGRAEAARSVPVRLHGVVTFRDWFLTFVQDSTGGIYVRNFDPAVRAGQEVEVEGFSAVGRSVPTVTGRRGGQVRIRVLGSGPWPQAIETAATQLDSDTLDAQWVKIRTKVTTMNRAHDGVMLDTVSEGIPVRVAIPRWPQNRALPGYLRGQ